MGRLHERLAASVLGIVMVSACGSPGDVPSISSSFAPATSSPSSDRPASIFASPPDGATEHPSEAAATPVAAPSPPLRWWGLQQPGDDTLVVAVAETGSTPTAVAPGTFEGAGDGTVATDLAGGHGGPVLAELSEPASGSLGVVEGDALVRPDPPLGAVRVDVDGNMEVVADTAGVWVVVRAGDDYDAAYGAVDVSVLAGSVVALIDPARRSVAPAGEALPAGLAFATSDVLGHVALDVSNYCGVVLAERNQVLLLRGPLDGYTCQATGIDVFDPQEETLTPLPMAQLGTTALRNVGIDPTGSYVIATAVDGSVRWSSIDGSTGGQLADAGFVAADWDA